MPNIKLLGNLEEKIRFAAHRVAGIPAHLLNATAEFARARLTVDNRDGLSVADLERVTAYSDQARRSGVDTAAFESDLAKIFWLSRMGVGA